MQKNNILWLLKISWYLTRLAGSDSKRQQGPVKLFALLLQLLNKPLFLLLPIREPYILHYLHRSEMLRYRAGREARKGWQQGKCILSLICTKWSGNLIISLSKSDLQREREIEVMEKPYSLNNNPWKVDWVQGWKVYFRPLICHLLRVGRGTDSL